MIDNRTPPRFLYIYQSKLKHVKDVLNNHRIYLSDPCRFNDVFDLAVTINYDMADSVNFNEELLKNIIFFMDVSYREKAKSSIQVSTKKYLTMKDALMCLIDNEIPEVVIREAWQNCFSLIPNTKLSLYRVACLTETNDSELMWGYYGNALKGYCLCFDTYKDEKLRNGLRKVNYSQDRPLSNADDLSVFLTKSAMWKHEKEWRFVLFGKDEYIETNACVGIIIGEKVHKNTKGQIIRICKRENLFMKIAYADEKKYEIHVENLKDYYTKKHSIVSR